ncbi:MAG: translation initiation factor [Bacteroidales bacterium]
MAQNDWKSRLGVVFSTNPEFGYQNEQEEETKEIVANDKQKLTVSLDKRNRRGKQVTIVTGYRGSAQALEELEKILKTKCGTGGSAKDGEIIIQGDFRSKVVSVLESLGYNAKRGN